MMYAHVIAAHFVGISEVWTYIFPKPAGYKRKYSVSTEPSRYLQSSSP